MDTHDPLEDQSEINGQDAEVPWVHGCGTGGPNYMQCQGESEKDGSHVRAKNINMIN